MILSWPLAWLPSLYRSKWLRRWAKALCDEKEKTSKSTRNSRHILHFTSTLEIPSVVKSII